MDFAPGVPEHKGFGPAALGHKDFSLATLGQKDAKPIALGHEDFLPAATRLDSDHALRKVDPVDMSTRVVVAWVDLVAARANLAVVKVVPAAAKVDLAKA